MNKLLATTEVADRTPLIPGFDDPEVWIPLLLIPLAIQWWSSWYPGAEPGGGGYVAQRMLAARDEKNAVAATLLFNVAHYALRPWPWIIIALCSIVVFPDLESIGTAFPDMDPAFVDDDLAFPAMLTYLPQGLYGLVMAALIAAFMSTISTHLNWGSSYVIHDFYARFINPQATEKQKVNLGRITTAILMILASLVALQLSNALEAFQILLQIGAGTGLIFILRWFWWRINAYSEIAAMIVSFFIAWYFKYDYEGSVPSHWQMVIGVVITTIVWLTVTFATRPTDQSTLAAFYKKIRPYDYGWKKVIAQLDDVPIQENGLRLDVMSMVYGCIAIYCLLFSTGYFIYGNIMLGLMTLIVAIFAALLLRRNWIQLRFD